MEPCHAHSSSRLQFGLPLHQDSEPQETFVRLAVDEEVHNDCCSFLREDRCRSEDWATRKSSKQQAEQALPLPCARTQAEPRCVGFQLCNLSLAERFLLSHRHSI